LKSLDASSDEIFRCGSLVFPASVRGGPVAGLTERTNDVSRDGQLPDQPHPHGLGASSKHLYCLAGNQPPLMGFVVRPSIDIFDHGLLSASMFPSMKSSGTTGKRPPPSWFRTTSTVAPCSNRKRIAACCQSWGSPCFARSTGASAFAVSSEHRVPHDAVRTLRRIPLADSRTASPRPLPSCRLHRLQGVAPSRVRNLAGPLPVTRCPILPWALFPSKATCNARVASNGTLPASWGL